MKRKLFFVLLAICLTTSASFSQEKKDEYPKTKFSGLIFGDYYYNAARDSVFNPKLATNAWNPSLNNASTGKQNENSVQIRRVQFRFNHQLSKSLEAQFMLETDPASKLPTNNLSTYIKDAYMKWKYFKGHEVIFGLIPTTAYDVPENFWGHRFLEKTILDLRSVSPNRDFGIALRGKIDSIGKFKYGIGFGEGAKLVPSSTDWYKEYYGNFQYSPILEFNEKNEIIRELSVNIFADFKEKPTIVNTYYLSDGSKGKSNFNGNGSVYDLTTGYKVKDKYSFGLEFYYAVSKSTYKDTASKSFVDQTGIGFSIYGSYQINEKFGAVARYDYFEPNSHSSLASKGDTRNYLIAGINYSPVKNFTISPNVLVETYEAKINGIINPDGTKKNLPYKASITPRVTFCYIFK